MMAKNVITQGLPYTWPVSYPVKAGTIGGRLILRGGGALTAAGIIQGNRLSFQLTAENTAGLEPGIYFYEVRRNTATSEETIERMRITVIGDLEKQTGNYDGTSENQKNLAAINATIAARAKGGVPVRYRIGNRELYSESLTELMALQRYYQNLVNLELAQESGANLWGRKVRYALK